MNGIISANTLDILGRAGQRAGYIMKKEVTFNTIKDVIRHITPEKVNRTVRLDNSSAIESINLLGVRVHLVTEKRLHNYIADVIDKGRKKLVLNVNVHCYNMIFKNPWMRDFFNKAEMVFCDGCGVTLGAKLLGLRMPIRFTPADSIWNLAALAEKKGHSFYFLGAKKGIAEKAAQKMKEKYPGLKITTHHGYFNKDRNSAENQKIIQEINASKANILVVGFGMPIQEKWLQENWEQLNVNIGFPAGALFDYVSGELRRGPRWMTENHLEWLARLLIEPKRLWKRYFVGNTVFLCKVIAERLKNTAPEESVTGNRKKYIITKPYVASRKHPRIKLHGYAAKITHNGVRYYATINDASPEGIQLGNIPSVLTKQKDQFHITISDMLGSMEYQLTLQKRWAKKEGRRLTAAGFSIVNAPNEWKMLMPQPAT